MHEPNQFDLLKERRFAPFFWTQFLGAANDNVFKNALVIFAAFHAASLTTLDASTLVNVAGAVFIAPFVLLSATSGQLADKYEKSRLIRWIKLFEIAIMTIGLAGFWQRDLVLLMSALALMGVHSTLFGPVKYAILPQHLKPEELVGGNGLVEMGTFVAILLGTIAGGLVVAIAGVGPGRGRGGGRRDRRRRLRRQPRHPEHAGGGARPQDQLEPVHRDLEEPRSARRATASSGCRCSASRGSGTTARSCSRSSRASPRTCWAATSTS